MLTRLESHIMQFLMAQENIGEREARWLADRIAKMVWLTLFRPESTYSELRTRCELIEDWEESRKK